MDEHTVFSLMVDLHRDGNRQGPGTVADTLRALDLTRFDPNANLSVADIGCGSGGSTLTLARALASAHITAIDLFPELLEILAREAEIAGFADRIETRVESMDALGFEHESLDLIWSEGAIYNTGFTAGTAAWRPFLKPRGVLAVSEITWLHPDPPAEIRDHWNTEYPEMATAAEKIAIMERNGFDLLGYFTLPPSSWIETYYAPTEQRIPAFLKRHAGTELANAAAQIAAMERQEIDLYTRYQNWFSYGFYVAQCR